MADDDNDDTEGLARLARAELRRRGKSDEEIEAAVLDPAHRPDQPRATTEGAGEPSRSDWLK